MKFDGIKKVSEGRFINRYDLYYTTEDDKKKVYEIISRNKDIKTIEDIRNEMFSAFSKSYPDRKSTRLNSSH